MRPAAPAPITAMWGNEGEIKVSGIPGSLGSAVTPQRSSTAYSGFFLNLFNLIPISLLDGGRITVMLSPKIWLLGEPILVGLFVMSPSPMLLVIGLLAAPQLMAAWRFRADDPVSGNS